MAFRLQFSRCIAEFVGTFLLVLTVGCNVLAQNSVWGGVAIASVLMVSIYSLGGISGANFNPAVSWSLFIAKHLGGANADFDLKMLIMYAISQTSAGIAASFTYCLLYGDAFNLSPAKGFSWWQAGLCEVLYTSMLCFVVLNVAAAKKYAEPEHGNQFFGLAIGFVIIAAAYGAGAVSGGCFNPAVAIGIDTSSHTRGWGWCLYYTFFELIGATLAAFLFMLVRPGDFSQTHHTRAGPVSKFVSEFIGTFMLVLTVGLNILGRSKAGAFSIAASLMCMIYALGDVSGGHFNPAVTAAVISVRSEKELTPILAVSYMVAQILGGISAATMCELIYWGASPGVSLQTLSWDDSSWARIILAEFIFTAVLVFVVLSVACSEKTNSTTMHGLAIGSCVTVGGFAAAKLSGGSLNPAVSVGFQTIYAISSGTGKFSSALVYSVFEMLGAGFAVGLFWFTHSAFPKELLAKGAISKV